MAISQILYSERQRGETRREIGWRLDNLLPALRLLAIPTAVAAILILGTGWWNATIRLERHNFYFWLMGLVLWALAQQFVLQGFMNRRFQLIYGKGKTSVVCVAVIFAILHLPNPLLCVLTFVSALLWGFAYQRYPNLFAVALSHATLSCLLAISLPNWLLNNLRVGFKYFG
jgi:membrane protease YdiL (CAAX protease family)